MRSTQRKFNKAMRKIERTESRSQNRFYSYLERDVIKGYYAIKNRRPSKLVKIGIKIMQFILAAIILVLGMLLALAIAQLDPIGSFYFASFLSFTLFIFGLIYPHLIFAAHHTLSRRTIAKWFGTTAVLTLIAAIVCSVVMPA